MKHLEWLPRRRHPIPPKAGRLNRGQAYPSRTYRGGHCTKWLGGVIRPLAERQINPVPLLLEKAPEKKGVSAKAEGGCDLWEKIPKISPAGRVGTIRTVAVNAFAQSRQVLIVLEKPKPSGVFLIFIGKKGGKDG